jgi:hypothetical protein
MGQGFVADTNALAIRVGELKAVATEVDSAILSLDISGGDLGPGDIAGAIAEVADQWRDNLGEMRDKIDTIAGNVSSACENYETIERGGEERMRALAEGTVRDEFFNALREASPAYQQERVEQAGNQNAKQRAGE